MKRFVLFLVAAVYLAGCSACLEDDELIALDCTPGQQQVCDHEGNDYPNARTNPNLYDRDSVPTA